MNALNTLSTDEKGFIQVLVNGQVESAQFSGLDSLSCKYLWSYGRDWTVKLGTEEAQSQQAEKQPGDPTIVWNLPIDATFQTTEPFGWPQISLQLYGPDFMGRTVMRGYGAVHVPTQAGHHEMYVQVFTPKSSSTFQSIQSTLMGTPPEFHNAKFATTGEARCVTRVQSLGTVKVCMDVVLVNMKALDLVS